MSLLLRIKLALTFLFLKVDWKYQYTYSVEFTLVNSSELPFQLEIRVFKDLRRDKWEYRITRDRTWYASGLCNSFESAKKHAINNYARLILTGSKYFEE